MRSRGLALLLASVICGQAADVLFVNGKIYQGNQSLGTAEAMLVRDERIVAIGPATSVRPTAAPGFREVDLHGRTVIPGLIDTHTHALDWARSVVRGELDLRYPNVRSIPDIQKQVAARVHDAKPKDWVLGLAWDDSKLAEDRYPTRQDLDAVSPNTPVYLSHATGHLAVANSEALRLADINAKTPDPVGGVIDHDAAGQPTGILKDSAMELVTRHLLKPTLETSLQAVTFLSKACAEVGLTTIHDVALLQPALTAYQEAKRQGLLRVRVQLSPLVASAQDADHFDSLGISTGFGDQWLRLGAIKMFADGGMAARTIALFPPSVINEVSNFGLLLWKPEDMKAVQMTLAEHGWQIATHAIGDRAIDEVIDSYALIKRRFPDRDLRNRVIHGGLATPAIQARLKQEKVLVDSNPPFVYFLGKHFSRFGPVRGIHAYPAKSYIDNGIIASGGSDVYVSPLSPWWGLWALVERKEMNSGEVLAPEERITIAQAIKMYTWNGAYTGFEEQDKGSLEVGKLADFVVLDRDLLHVPSAEIKDVKVMATWIGGVPVYERH